MRASSGGHPVAIVTGGSGSIGSAIVDYLVDTGYQAVIADLTVEDRIGTSSTDAPGIHTLRTDMTDHDSVRALVDRTVSRLGRLDAFVNNVGVTWPANLWDLTTADWERMFAVNTIGTFHGIETAAAVMREQDGGGSIVNISSIAALGWREGRNAAYAAAKAGVLGLTRSAAQALGPLNVRVNAVCPGVVRTELFERWLEGVADSPDERRRMERDIADQTALRRIASPNEIAAAVGFLASPAASAITGQTLNVDCGTILS